MPIDPGYRLYMHIQVQIQCLLVVPVLTIKSTPLPTLSPGHLWVTDGLGAPPFFYASVGFQLGYAFLAPN